MNSHDPRDLSQGEFAAKKYGDMAAGAIRKLDFNGEKCNNAQRAVQQQTMYAAETKAEVERLDAEISKQGGGIEKPPVEIPQNSGIELIGSETIKVEDITNA